MFRSPKFFWVFSVTYSEEKRNMLKELTTSCTSLDAHGSSVLTSAHLQLVDLNPGDRCPRLTELAHGRSESQNPRLQGSPP